MAEIEYSIQHRGHDFALASIRLRVTTFSKYGKQDNVGLDHRNSLLFWCPDPWIFRADIQPLSGAHYNDTYSHHCMCYTQAVTTSVGLAIG